MHIHEQLCAINRCYAMVGSGCYGYTHECQHTSIITFPGIDNGKPVFLYISDLLNKLVFDVDTGQTSIFHLKLAKFYDQ